MKGCLSVGVECLGVCVDAAPGRVSTVRDVETLDVRTFNVGTFDVESSSVLAQDSLRCSMDDLMDDAARQPAERLLML